MTNNIISLVASTSTGDKSPEEALEALTQAGFEWYVTEGGALMFKTWQIIKDFVTPEQAAEIRTMQKPRTQIEDIEWLSRNLESVRLNYAEQWVAIHEERIVAAATNLPNLLSQISEYEKPFITFITEEEIVWDLAYGN